VDAFLSIITWTIKCSYLCYSICFSCHQSQWVLAQKWSLYTWWLDMWFLQWIPSSKVTSLVPYIHSLVPYIHVWTCWKGFRYQFRIKSLLITIILYRNIISLFMLIDCKIVFAGTLMTEKWNTPSTSRCVTLASFPLYMVHSRSKVSKFFFLGNGSR
jgi:hypothetical protein